MSIDNNGISVKENFIISKIYGAYYEIYSPERGFQRATLKGKLRLDLESSGERHPFVVGDEVYAENFQNQEEWVILLKKERRNFLVRKSMPGDSHVLCANLDYVAIIVSLADPETKDGFIDRTVASCHHAKIEPLLIFNKKDIVSEELAEERTGKYKKLGYNVFLVASTELESLDELLLVLQNKTTYLVGNSGVGKSTFINSIVKENIQKIGEVSSSTKKGKHTTTNSSLIILNDTTKLIDSPGVKEWGILHLSRGDILNTFPELAKYKKKCTITGCCTYEDGCIIMERLDKLEDDRLKSLEAMFDSIDTPYRLRTGNYISGKAKETKQYPKKQKSGKPKYNYKKDEDGFY